MYGSLTTRVMSLGVTLDRGTYDGVQHVIRPCGRKRPPLCTIVCALSASIQVDAGGGGGGWSCG